MNPQRFFFGQNIINQHLDQNTNYAHKPPVKNNNSPLADLNLEKPIQQHNLQLTKKKQKEKLTQNKRNAQYRVHLRTQSTPRNANSQNQFQQNSAKHTHTHTESIKHLSNSLFYKPSIEQIEGKFKQVGEEKEKSKMTMKIKKMKGPQSSQVVHSVSVTDRAKGIGQWTVLQPHFTKSSISLKLSNGSKLDRMAGKILSEKF